MKWSNVIISVILSAIISSTLLFILNGKTQSLPLKETVYDRVMHAKTLRCGYASWPPLIIKNSANGQLSGIFYDYMESLGKALNLKIEWSEEVSWGDFPAALESGRIDAFCAGAWPNASRASQIDFTIPISYQAIYAYVRADDMRFDNNITAVDNPSVTTVSIDGEMSALITSRDFPKAKTVQMPQMSGSSDLFMNVVTGKGDVTFTDPITASMFEANNPGKIRQVITKTPLRVFGNPVAIARGQDEFRRMIDTATQEILYNGDIEKILAKYETVHGSLLRVMPGYQGAIP